MTTRPEPSSLRLAVAPETLQPPPLETIICQEVVGGSVRYFGKELQSVVLTGSLARNEGTFECEDGLWKLLGDAEFLLVFRDRTTLPHPDRIEALCRDVQVALLRRGIDSQLSLSASHRDYLRKMRPHIFAFELRAYGQVVWGDLGVLSLIPAFTPSEIPLEDAWQLLCNRMIEILEVLPELEGRPDTLPPAVFYRTLKLYLDMATSFLLFVGAYEPTYLGRAERLERLAESTKEMDRFPFNLRRFSQRVNALTRRKVSGHAAEKSSGGREPSGADFAFFEEALAYARLLWRWELECLTHAPSPASNRELVQRWMRGQPLQSRLRGWFYVLRKLRSHSRWRQWMGWKQRPWKASPRYWVYAAASELFFRIPVLLRANPDNSHLESFCQELRSWLPMTSPKQNGRASDWRRLASEIVRNYHEFLVETRA